MITEDMKELDIQVLSAMLLDKGVSIAEVQRLENNPHAQVPKRRQPETR